MGRKQQAPKAGGLSALHKPGNTTSAFRVLDWGLPGPPASTGRTCEQCRRQILKETLDMVNLPSGSEIAANLFSHALAAARTRQLALEELLGQAEKLKALSQRGLAVELYKSWIAFNPDHKLLHAAYFNYAVDLTRLVTAQAPSMPFENASELSKTFILPTLILGGCSRTAARSGTPSCNGWRLPKPCPRSTANR
jgi:hypothetical protein